MPTVKYIKDVPLVTTVNLTDKIPVSQNDIDAHTISVEQIIDKHTNVADPHVGKYAYPLGADDNYVTDAEKTKLANLSGTNTGDQDLSGYAQTSSLGTAAYENTSAFDAAGAATGAIAAHVLENDPHSQYLKESDAAISFEQLANKGQANGYAPLGAAAKIDEIYLPDSVLGQVEYQGVWNATTNTPTIPAASSANKGYYYIVSVSGTTEIDGISDWTIGDWIVSNGTAWNKIDNTDSVSSVFGRAGAIVANSGDYTADQITETTTRAFLNPQGQNHILMDTAPTAVPTAEGTLSWDTVNNALQVQTEFPDVILTPGMEDQQHAFNNTGSTILNGTVVYPSGTYDADTWYVDKTDPTSQAKCMIFGVATHDIPHGTRGRVTTRGIVHNLDTSAFAETATLYVSTTTPGQLSTTRPLPPNYPVVVGKVNKSHATEGSIYLRPGDAPASIALTNMFDTEKDPTGWVNPEGIGVSYNSTSRTITLTGDLRYMWQGELRSLTSPWTSAAHGTADANYYLFSTDGVTIGWSTSVWDFTNLQVAAATFYTSPVVRKFAIREVHSLMPWRAHQEFHQTNGCYRLSGGALTTGTYAENTASDAATTPGFDVATIKDEDNISTIPAWTQGTYTTVYIGASSQAYTDTTSSFPFRYAPGGYIYINNPVTGTNTEAANNTYANVYQVLVPVTSDVNSQKYRMVMVQPQASYASLAAAQAENPAGLIFGDLSSQVAEIVIYARITYLTASGDTNTGKCRIATGGVTYLTGTRNFLLSGGSVGMSNPMTTQGSLIVGGAGGVPNELFKGTAKQMLTVDDTATSLVYRDASAANISNTPAGNIAATTVQAAINELDSEKAAISHTQAESTITFTDITTGNTSTTKHGYMPKSYSSSAVVTDSTGDIQYIAAGTSGVPLVSAVGSYPRFAALSLSNASAIFGSLPIANGGTGSATQNFVDLTTAQSIAGSKTFSNQIVFSAGSAAAPAISTAGDLNTGIYFPSADTVGIATNGVARYIFGPTGNVTFTNNSNNNQFVLSGTNAATSGSVAQLIFSQGSDFIASINAINAGSLDSGILTFATQSAGSINSERARITSSGALLVGRTAETSVPKLQVGFANPAASPTYSAAVDVAVFNSLAAAVIQIQGPTSSGIGFSSDTVRSAGYIGYTHSTNQMEFRTNATAKMVLTTDGYLIVNNTASVGAYALQVTGHGYFNGNIASTGGLIWSFGTGSWQFRNSGKSTILEATANDGTGLLYLRSGNVTTSGSHVVIADAYSGNVLIGSNIEHPNPAKTQITSSILGLSVKADTADTARFWRPVNSISAVVGRILFGGYVDTSTYGDYASIGSIIENSTSATKAGAIAFNTASSGTITEKARLTAAGELLVGTNSSMLAGYKLQAYSVTDGNEGCIIKNGSTGTLATTRINLNSYNDTFQIIKYGSGYSGRSNEAHIYNGVGDMYFSTNAGTERLRITQAGSTLINTPTDPGYTAKLHVAGGISLDNVANANARVLDWYEEGTFTATASGMTTSPTGTVKYTRIGNQVTLDLPGISGTSNATTFTLSGMPTQLRPAAAKAALAVVQDNGAAFVYGKIVANTDGSLTLSKDANGSAFTASGTKAIAVLSVTYTLQ